MQSGIFFHPSVLIRVHLCSPAAIHPMNWNVTEIVDAITDALRDAAREKDREQAVYGIDDLTELKMHPLIHAALRGAGYGVWPEQTYPSARTGRKRKSEGKRCDIVLT